MPMQYARIIYKIAEVAFSLVKVLGGNWAAIVGLVLSMSELHAELWPEPQIA